MTGFAPQRDMSPADSASVRGWAGCRDALSGSTLGSDPCAAGLIPEPTNNLLLMDGEHHQAVRRLLAPHLGRARLDQVGRRLAATASALVEALADAPEPDLVRGLAEPLVLDGILSVLQVREDHRDRLAGLAREMLGLLEPDLPADQRRRASRAALRATLLFERDGLAGTSTGLHATLEAAARDGVIPVKLARSTPVVVLHGGYENPLNQLGCLAAWALADPDRFRVAATAGPELVFEEVLRVYSPVRRAARWAATDGECGGRAVRRGELVWIDLASGNADTGRFPAGAHVDLSRRQGNLGFGHGRHLCPGTALARLEGAVFLRSLLAVPAGLLGELTVRWRDGAVARGPSTIGRS